MRAIVLRVAFAAQVVLLVVAYRAVRITTGRRAKTVTWVVGPRETASIVSQLAAVIPGSHSVSLAQHEYYDQVYDSVIRAPRGPIGRLALLVRPVLLLARLMNRAQGFIYVSQTGFLLSRIDNRRFEFGFLERHGLAICCYFTGNDIRSPHLMHELEKKTGRPNIATQLRLVGTIFETDAYEAEKRGLAEVADRFADVIYSCSVDQLSYLQRPTEPFAYFLPESRLLDRFDKFKDAGVPVILHAPSSPQLKGTPAVRAAIDRLRTEGRSFEYVELIDVANEVVLDELARAHIVLNQFYAFMPGVFGVEALASCCAVLMSADDRLEPDLPPGSHDSWVVTPIDLIYDNLDRVLTKPALMEKYARAGSSWARNHASAEASAARLNSVLGSVLDGTYSGPVPRSQNLGQETDESVS